MSAKRTVSNKQKTQSTNWLIVAVLQQLTALVIIRCILNDHVSSAFCTHTIRADHTNLTAVESHKMFIVFYKWKISLTKKTNHFITFTSIILSKRNSRFICMFYNKSKA